MLLGRREDVLRRGKVRHVRRLTKECSCARTLSIRLEWRRWRPRRAETPRSPLRRMFTRVLHEVVAMSCAPPTARLRERMKKNHDWRCTRDRRAPRYEGYSIKKV